MEKKKSNSVTLFTDPCSSPVSFFSLFSLFSFLFFFLADRAKAFIKKRVNDTGVVAVLVGRI